MFHEMGIIGEVVVLAMFEDEDTTLLQQSFLEDEAGDGRQFLQGIGRIGKDKVKLLLATFDEAKHIASQGHNGDWP